ncbi:hypothetical protein CEXT_534751 [Caerostris extrusa]|uniref:Uncharacterized protein n=1 Tax=Caerostris extrusa TaxID=172846 RepID=A0AAV4WTE1_CAEEX|nr:hypothetical protein CEXT_534751 [Caerostris extrusa]
MRCLLKAPQHWPVEIFILIFFFILPTFFYVLFPPVTAKRNNNGPYAVAFGVENVIHGVKKENRPCIAFLPKPLAIKCVVEGIDFLASICIDSWLKSSEIWGNKANWYLRELWTINS